MTFNQKHSYIEMANTPIQLTLTKGSIKQY
ncbi:hypothetical protein NMYAN_40012 [Nitrosomonas nitrosa]|jgi:hypothetical protein|uniref:Uncharacterized protein n=1 Tax=Nitrosomonas nitrosa TaxID=52442 RepID=A0A8H8Z133_9PROT|nr:hypothetical protein NMYAN_40012 [Nitrosomonas nitrosa]